MRFCVNYQRLNAITKKNRYLISLFEKTLAKLEDAKYFTRTDIRPALYQIRMSEG